jgi:hypothetical protein
MKTIDGHMNSVAALTKAQVTEHSEAMKKLCRSRGLTVDPSPSSAQEKPLPLPLLPKKATAADAAATDAVAAAAVAAAAAAATAAAQCYPSVVGGGSASSSCTLYCTRAPHIAVPHPAPGCEQ